MLQIYQDKLQPNGPLEVYAGFTFIYPNHTTMVELYKALFQQGVTLYEVQVPCRVFPSIEFPGSH